jgi:cbb3-type cytochrome oxidase subunit 3
MVMDDVMAVIVWMQQHSILMVLACFLLIVATAYWPGRKVRVERNALIPLQDDR